MVKIGRPQDAIKNVAIFFYHLNAVDFLKKNLNSCSIFEPGEGGEVLTVSGPFQQPGEWRPSRGWIRNSSMAMGGLIQKQWDMPFVIRHRRAAERMSKLHDDFKSITKIPNQVNLGCDSPKQTLQKAKKGKWNGKMILGCGDSNMLLEIG